jgi:hypothetical protein
MWIDAALTQYEFEGIDGKVHLFPGCSLVGLFEMERRLEELEALMRSVDHAVPAEELYQTHIQFRWTVDRCLKLNGIKPKWVNWEIASQMLFAPGILISINRPKSSNQPVAGPPATLEQLIAGLAHATGSIAEAIEVAKTQPAQPILAIATAYTEAGKTSQQKHDDKFGDWKRRKQEEAAKRQAQAG